ncbi:hypothetical protein DFH27DRAFT_608318 [Peziza echinospora]|nr:hypothetical protein DFH27DRAFT_608318 [Peziza echinospora]
MALFLEFLHILFPDPSTATAISTTLPPSSIHSPPTPLLSKLPQLAIAFAWLAFTIYILHFLALMAFAILFSVQLSRFAQDLGMEGNFMKRRVPARGTGDESLRYRDAHRRWRVRRVVAGVGIWCGFVREYFSPRGWARP